ncbi:MAG: hypothetical protein EAX96_19415 [Candidatus Lokiarchaeota archaeon]|nr:hypothetical protein [Candidatus Lokiarchaeota archaeon]
MGIHIFHQLYIINPKGICIFSLNFIKREIEPQMVAGYLSAMSDFSHEFMGGDFNKVDLFDEKLVVYEDAATKLKIAALTNTLDNTTLLRKIIIKILHKFEDLNINDKNGNFNLSLKEQSIELEHYIRDLLKRNTMKRDNKSSAIAFIIGALILSSFLIITGEYFIYLINYFINLLQNLFLSIPLNFNMFDPANAIITTMIITEMSAIFFLLQFYFNVGLIFSAYLYGYLLGSRKASFKHGISLLLVEIPISCIILFILRNLFLVIFYIFSFTLFFYLPVLSSTYLFYLGAIAREKRKLYHIPEGQKYRFILPDPENF